MNQPFSNNTMMNHHITIMYAPLPTMTSILSSWVMDVRQLRLRSVLARMTRWDVFTVAIMVGMSVAWPQWLQRKLFDRDYSMQVKKNE